MSRILVHFSCGAASAVAAKIAVERYGRDRDFPDIFAQRAKVQRDLGVGFNSGGNLFYLDELDPNEGFGVPEPPIECGMFCGQYTHLVALAVRGASPQPSPSNHP